MKHEKDKSKRKARRIKLLVILLSIIFCYSLFLNIYASVKRPAFGAQIVYDQGNNYSESYEYIIYNEKKYIYDDGSTNYVFKGNVEREALTGLMSENGFWQNVFFYNTIYGFEFDDNRDFIYLETQNLFYTMTFDTLTFRRSDFVYPTIEKSKIKALVFGYMPMNEYTYKRIEDDQEIQKILNQIKDAKTEIHLTDITIEKMKGTECGLYIDYEDSPVCEDLGRIEKRGNDFYFIGIDVDIDLNELS